MTESLISQRIQIPTRQKSQSISEIENQQLRVSFSILSIFQPQDNLPSHEKQLNSLTTRQEQQFNKEYVPSLKKYQIPKNTTSTKVKSINLHDQKTKRQNQYVGEYFQSTQIQNPKMNSNQFKKNIVSSNRSSKKDVSNKKEKSRSNCRSGQKSTKSIQSTKKISSPFNFMKRHQKSPSDYKFKMINSPYSPRIKKTPSKGKVDNKIKAVKEIVIICNDQNFYKSKNQRKNQIQNLSYKENIVSNKQNIFAKHSVGKNSSKSKNKKILTGQIKQQMSQKHFPYVSSDYWSCGVQVLPKSKGKSKQQKLSRNSALKKFKQKFYPY